MKHHAFLNVIDPVKDKIYRLALRLLISREAAEDATQEVIVKLWSGKDKLKHYANVEAFAMTVTKNHCFDELKSKKNSHLKIVDQNYESKAISLQREMEVKDEMFLIEKIIQGLPAQQQLIFQLRDVEQYEFEEIEAITGMNATTIRVTLSRARKKIRESLTKKHNYGIARA